MPPVYPHQEVVVFMDETEMSIVIVNPPFGIEGDSRLFITLLLRAARNRTGGIVSNLVRLLRCQPVLNVHDESNVLIGFVLSKVVEICFKQKGRIASAFLKHGCAPVNVNAFERCRLV
mmetsp:Transcript_2001/g.4379  ORF Transcript_2001/g.4379 Transcript_2001/m.4379 type:complete len:118 (-) Transcript_2001:951-1304(-)